MNKTKIFLQRSLIFSLKIAHSCILFLKKILGRKTILFVSKERIKSYSLGPLSQISILIFVFWLGVVFANSIRYNRLIEKKSAEIVNLQKVNQKFEDEVESLNVNLQTINSYFTTISGYQNPEDSKKSQNVDEKVKEIFGNTKLDGSDKEIATKIADSNLMLENIDNATTKRIDDLQQKIALADIAFTGNKIVLSKSKNNNSENQNIVSLNNKNDLLKRQGGPLKSFQQMSGGFLDNSIFHIGKGDFSIKNKIEYLTNLEKFIRKAPFSAPMKNYYVSSGFGERSDPIRGVASRHEGMDFVGGIGSRIVSPSDGKVIFAGKFSSYGNMIILDHGYGLTTRYGHLSKISVVRGDDVKKNQMIALQGNSGRSTGPHLHYEVRYKNIPMNPKKFLKAGQEIFNTDKPTNNVEI